MEDIQKSIIENDRNFVVSMFVMICFALSWLPIIITVLLPSTLLSSSDVGTMKFAFMWLGIGGSSSKLLIFFFINPEFRRTFCAICTGMTATSTNSESASYSSLDFIECCIPEQRSWMASLCCCLFCGCCICARKTCCCCKSTTSSTSVRTTTTYYPTIQNNQSRIINSSSSQNEIVRGTSMHLTSGGAISDPTNNFINSRYFAEYGSFPRYATTNPTEGYS